MVNCKDPMEEVYAVRRKISERYGHNPDCYYQAMTERQNRSRAEGRVYWGYNEAGELAPLAVSAVR
ncbi:MAG: hypothetical protein ACI4RA_01345 [Kiritimatiellia bacterium]